MDDLPVFADGVAIDDVDPAPWARSDWTGQLLSADGAPTDDFTRDDVLSVLAWATTPSDWDGETAGIAMLRDGRVIAWESAWGPTGNGFACDAYGGTADITFAFTVGAAWRSLSASGQELLRG